jgi:hypothetical protein
MLHHPVSQWMIESYMGESLIDLKSGLDGKLIISNSPENLSRIDYHLDLPNNTGYELTGLELQIGERIQPLKNVLLSGESISLAGIDAMQKTVMTPGIHSGTDAAFDSKIRNVFRDGSIDYYPFDKTYRTPRQVRLVATVASWNHAVKIMPAPSHYRSSCVFEAELHV